MSGKKWEIIRKMEENEEGIRSWLVRYAGKVTYVISEVPSTGSNPFRLLGDKEDNKKRETYSTTNR